MELVNPDEEMGSLNVDRLRILSRSLKSFYFEIEGKVSSEFEIGWVSAVKIIFEYDGQSIGTTTVRDKPMVLDDKHNLKTGWTGEQEPKMQIKNMRAFQAFLRGVMPKKNADTPVDSQNNTVAHLSVSPSGHTLKIYLDLSCMTRMRATVTSLKIHGDEISITMKITNLSSLELLFDWEGTFLLKKGQQTVGELGGCLDIVPGEFEVDLEGHIQSGVSGMVTLKGDFYEDMDPSWQEYAIKLFEVEINLDEMDVDGNTVHIADHGEHLLSIRSK
ncbi:hypothetical protein ACHAPE_005342 [Trichoderma viride]